MICNKCGNNCPENARFCRQCGTQLTAAQVLQPQTQEVQPQMVQSPEAPSVKPAKAKKGTGRGIPRIVPLIFMLFLILVIDIFMLGFVKNDVVGEAEKIRYRFDDFSISMQPDMILDEANTYGNYIQDLEIGGKHFEWAYKCYGYRSEKANFFAYSSHHYDDAHYTGLIKDNPGELSHYLGSKWLTYNKEYKAEPYKVSGDIVRYTVDYNGMTCYVYAREIVMDHRIVVCGFYSRHDYEDLFTSWLSTIEVRQ